jgi:hypothetical protein
MITNRMAKLRARRTDPFIKAATAFDEALKEIKEEDAIQWVIQTMQPMEREYTESTIAEGDRVKSQLDKGLNSNRDCVAFRYQGSVTNNTHVKVHSDLDLLVLDTDFSSIEPPGKASFPYSGNPLTELKQLRADCVAVLKQQFPAVKVDNTSGKCIALSGGSLRREIDVVIAIWWNTVEYQKYSIERNRGVKVFDANTLSRIENKPFYHNYMVDSRDGAVNGNLRKMCRFLKSVKYDANLGISSYDIVSIAWNMPDEYLAARKGQELLLVSTAKSYLKFLIENDSERNALMVPNQMRRVFGSEGATKSQLMALFNEVHELADEIGSILTKTYRNIQDAQVAY